ncbi:M16 family metallopeptidase [Pseudomonas tohonis]|uniref:M16 family metallopeptidase n=1 Tax=Pseudomonas tohonis TaxID=2725477 RepID=UPI00255B6276|nr:pitrilysin family protein [Pseudomonas tohonis]
MRYLLCLLLLLGATVHAADRDRVEGYELQNGLQVILKPTSERGHVAIRLVVGVGFDDFACRDKELPHLLEHLFFSGLDGEGEAGLEARMQALGGEWNAFTSTSDTAFVIEAPAQNQRKVLDLLLQVLGDTPLDDTRIATAKQVVEREGGGHYSHLERLLDQQDLGREAHEQLAVELGLACAERPQVAHLQREALEALRRDWYAPNNMSLIVVGDLDRLLPAFIERRFGALAPVEVREHPELPTSNGNAAERRTLRRGLVGESATLHWIFPEPEVAGADYAAWELLKDYLDWELYQQLRIQGGLSYGPWTERRAFGAEVFLSLNADLERDDVEPALAVLRRITARLRDQGLDPATFERLRGLAISRQAWAAQGNTALADYYWGALGDYQDGHFGDEAAALRAVTPQQVDAIARELFRQPGYIRIEQPLLGYDQLGWLLPALLALALPGALLWHRRRKAPRTAPA